MCRNTLLVKVFDNVLYNISYLLMGAAIGFNIKHIGGYLMPSFPVNLPKLENSRNIVDCY